MIFWTATECVVNDGFAPSDAGDGKGVVFTYKFISVWLRVSGDVAVRELVAFEALMIPLIISMEIGERKSW